MITPRVIALVAVCLLAGPPSFAQSEATGSSSNKQYHVEIIAFHYQGPDTSGGETLRRLVVEEYLPEPAFNIDEYNRVQEVVSYTGFKQLGGALERLRANPRYAVLSASAWVQPLLAQNRAVDVRVGEDAPASSEVLQDARGSAVPQMAGSLRVYGDHLLFVDLSLRARFPNRASPAQSSGDGDASSGRTRLEDAYEVYAINETRRIKLDEIHYFDHPYIGAIVSVTRHEGAVPESGS